MTLKTESGVVVAMGGMGAKKGSGVLMLGRGCAGGARDGGGGPAQGARPHPVPPSSIKPVTSARDSLKQCGRGPASQGVLTERSEKLVAEVGMDDLSFCWRPLSPSLLERLPEGEGGAAERQNSRRVLRSARTTCR